MLTTKKLYTVPPQHDVGAVAAPPARTRAPYYLVGERERSSAKPTNIDAGRTLVSVNGRWHGLRSEIATFEQVLSLAYPELDRPWSSATVSYRRGPSSRPVGSLGPGDVVTVADGMLINAQVTVLS